MTTGAFASVDLVMDTVSSVAGSGKTLTAIALARHRALTEGARTIFAMPTLELIAEMAEVARRQNDVPVMTIISETETDFAANEPRKRTTARLTEHLQRRTNGGEVVFVTHETMHRMGQDWPDETAAWELVIDEAPETILARAPFRLYDNWRILTAFLELGEPITRGSRGRRSQRAAGPP